jgi:ElaB/YqjD/DUF883 family membrane-anchored ribosome-binding protein
MSYEDKTISEIEQDMARSRAEIERTTEALKAKVEPENLAEAARQVIQESTQRVEERVRELADSAGERVESLGGQAVEYIQHNPMPALLAGLGLGVMITLAERAMSTPVTTVHPRGPEPGRLNRTLARHPRLLRAQRRTVRQARRMNHQNPWLLGACALGTGLLLGALLPTTRKEHEVMGPVRDRLLETGKTTAQQALEQAKRAMEQELQMRKAEGAELAQSAEQAALQAYHQARSDEPQQPIDATSGTTIVP